jgi:hypothetical protein
MVKGAVWDFADSVLENKVRTDLNFLSIAVFVPHVGIRNGTLPIINKNTRRALLDIFWTFSRRSVPVIGFIPYRIGRFVALFASWFEWVFFLDWFLFWWLEQLESKWGVVVLVTQCHLRDNILKLVHIFLAEKECFIIH